MNKTELIAVLESSQGNAYLGSVVSAALSIIRECDEIEIVDIEERGFVDRESLLGTYRLRQKRLTEKGLSLYGFEETITSLASQSSYRVNLIMVNAGAKHLALWMDPSGSLVGCYLGKDNFGAQSE